MARTDQTQCYTERRSCQSRAGYPKGDNLGLHGKIRVGADFEDGLLIRRHRYGGDSSLKARSVQIHFYKARKQSTVAKTILSGRRSVSRRRSSSPLWIRRRRKTDSKSIVQC